MPSSAVDDEDVLWLDVPMDDVPFLAVPKRRNQLLNDFTGYVLGKTLALSQSF